MTPERWQKVNELFTAVVDLEPEQRVASLDRSCADDQELRREVETLLASDSLGWDLIDKPAVEMAAPLLANEQPQLTPGQRLSHYQIIRLIGTGGMGEVYLAQDELLKRKVAVKLLPADYTQDKQRLRRFQQEAQSASALNHPNILTIHELGDVNGQQFIATEFVEGEPLRERLKRTPLNLGETLDITIQIAGALVAAHKAGIIHRDIKPENIMLRHDGYVKVLDFGLAKLTEQPEPATETHAAENVNISSGLVMGTVKYMSPEQARGQSVDSRTDIFSLGVVLYEMVTGHAPFKGENTSDFVKSILRDAARPLAEYTLDAPEELQGIISKALDKNRGKRYQSANELLVALKALRQKLEISTESHHLAGRAEGAPTSIQHSVRTASTIEFFASRIREHKPMVGFVGLLVLLVGIGYPMKNWIRSRGPMVKELKVTMLSSTGNVEDAAISRDGKLVAYIPYEYGAYSSHAFRSSIRMRDLATNNETQLTPDTGAYDDLVFSPDGRYLYYSDRSDTVANQRSLYRTSIDGGPAEKITDYFPPGSRKVTFSPDGKKFAFIRQDERAGSGTLVIANFDGAQEKSIVTRKAPDFFPSQSRGASWSPDGKHIVYVGVNAADGYARIFEVDLESLTEKPLTSQRWNDLIRDLTWLPDSSGILFIAGNTSISNAIWRLSYPGGQLQQITNDLNNHDLLSVAGDSNTLLTVQWTRYVDLWIAPDSDASRARRIMPSTHDGYYGVAWAPDGKIVYTSETRGNSDIWIANADGTNQRQLTTDVHQDTRPAVTNDGRYIVFVSNRDGADHIWRMDIDGNNQIQLTVGAKAGHPSCSPDSRWVVYHALASGKTTIWKVSMEGGAPHEISNLACNNPAVSHDGSMIACMSGTHRRIVFPFDGGPAIASIELPVRLDFVSGIPRWMPDDRALMYADFSEGVLNFWIKPIDGGPAKQLTYFKSDQVAASHGVLSYAWSPDGKDLLYARIERKSDMVMISGFK